MKIYFTKMCASGNDFVIVENNNWSDNEMVKIAVAASNRNYGIGCDQFIFYDLQDRNLHNAKIDLRVFNQDGSKVAMCINMIRCLTGYFYEKSDKLINNFTFAVHCNDTVKNVEGSINEGLEVSVKVEDVTVRHNIVDVGNKHLVKVLSCNDIKDEFRDQFLKELSNDNESPVLRINHNMLKKGAINYEPDKEYNVSYILTDFLVDYASIMNDFYESNFKNEAEILRLLVNSESGVSIKDIKDRIGSVSGLAKYLLKIQERAVVQSSVSNYRIKSADLNGVKYIIDKSKLGNSVYVCTIERGAGLTMACGSGTVASVEFLLSFLENKNNVKINVITDGCYNNNLVKRIGVVRSDKSTKLIGGYNFIFDGKIEV